MANGVVDIVIIGSGYSRKQEDLFFKDAQEIKAEILLRPPFRQRVGQLFFHFMTPRGNLRCTGGSDGVGSETLVCSTDKIIDAVGDVLNELIIVVVNGKGSGSSDASRIAVVGAGSHDNTTETNSRLGGNFFQRLGAVATHEAGHCILGPSHVENTIMGSMTNGGANGIMQTFDEAQINTINAWIDGIAGPLIKATSPTVQITSPANNASVTPNEGGQILIRGAASEDTMKVVLLIDGQPDNSQIFNSTQIFWARNNIASFSNGIRLFPIVSPGVHTFTLKAIDVVGNETTSNVITVTVL